MVHKQHLTQKGFGIVELLVIVVALGLIGFLGWKAWDAYSTKPTTDNQATAQHSTTTTDTNQVSTAEAPNVNSKADLDKATKALDQVNVDGTETQDLNTQTSF